MLFRLMLIGAILKNKRHITFAGNMAATNNLTNYRISRTTYEFIQDRNHMSARLAEFSLNREASYTNILTQCSIRNKYYIQNRKEKKSKERLNGTPNELQDRTSESVLL